MTQAIISHTYIGSLLYGCEANEVEVIASQETEAFGKFTKWSCAIQEENFPNIKIVGHTNQWVKPNEVPSGNDWFFAAFPPCFIAGTQVLTKAGFKAIECVTTDDKVFTHKGRWKKVTSIMNRVHNGNIFQVEHPLSRGEKVTCTPEHPFFQLDGTFKEIKDLYNPSSGTIQSFTPFQYAGPVLPVPDIESTFTNPHSNSKFKNSWIVEEDMAWILGHWLAEGHYRHPRKTKHLNGTTEIYVSCHEDEVEYVKSRLSVYFTPNVVMHKGKAVKIAFGSEGFYKLLQEFGYKKGKKIADWVWSRNKSFKQALFDGYYYGDGRKNTNFRIETSSCSRQLSLDMAMLYMHNENKPASIKIRKGLGEIIRDFSDGKGPRKIVSNDSWTVSYIKEAGFKNQHTFSTAENVKPFKYGVDCTSQVTKLEDQSVTVYNLSVEDDESYQVNGVMTHNCSAGSGATRKSSQGGLENPKSAFIHTFNTMKYAYSLKAPLIAVESVPGTYTKLMKNLKDIRDEYGPEYGIAMILENSSYHGCTSTRKRFWHIQFRKDLFPNGIQWERGVPSLNPVSVSMANPESDYGVSPRQLKDYARFEPVISAMPQGAYFNTWLRKTGRWDLVPEDVRHLIKKKHCNDELYVFYESVAAYKLHPDKPCPTITGSTLLFHPHENRPLTSREYLRINGFPEDFKFPINMNHNDHITYIGKCATPEMCSWIIRNLKMNLESINV